MLNINQKTKLLLNLKTKEVRGRMKSPSEEKRRVKRKEVGGEREKEKRDKLP